LQTLQAHFHLGFPILPSIHIPHAINTNKSALTDR
jgi:hypothetical protein